MSWIAAVLATLLMPRGSSAYGSFQLLPYVGVTEVFDDNLFGVPSGGTTVTSAPPANSSAPPTTTHQNRESDFITRFTPGLEGTIQRGLFSLTGGYHFDSDIYAEHSEFTSGFAAQAGDIDATYDDLSGPDRIAPRYLRRSRVGTIPERRHQPLPPHPEPTVRDRGPNGSRPFRSILCGPHGELSHGRRDHDRYDVSILRQRPSWRFTQRDATRAPFN